MIENHKMLHAAFVMIFTSLMMLTHQMQASREYRFCQKTTIRKPEGSQLDGGNDVENDGSLKASDDSNGPAYLELTLKTDNKLRSRCINCDNLTLCPDNCRLPMTLMYFQFGSSDGVHRCACPSPKFTDCMCSYGEMLIANNTCCKFDATDGALTECKCADGYLDLRLEESANLIHLSSLNHCMWTCKTGEFYNRTHEKCDVCPVGSKTRGPGTYRCEVDDCPTGFYFDEETQECIMAIWLIVCISIASAIGFSLLLGLIICAARNRGD